MKLDPCPYCYDHAYVDWDNDTYSGAVRCGCCEMSGPREASKDKAIASWNALPRASGGLEGAVMLRAALERHHRWHLAQDDLDSAVPDGQGGWVAINMAEAYSESSMCDETIAALRALPDNSGEVERLKAASAKVLSDMDSLVAESAGVYGLHLNDDNAPWGDLLAGGSYEEWLMSLEDLRQALAGTKP